MTTHGHQPPDPSRSYYILPGTHVGAYAIRGAIGQGGGQAAYLAESPDGRPVVLKVSLFPKGEEGSASRKMHERFLRQVACLMELRGTLGVANVFGHDMYPDQTDSSHAYLVQEWIPGNINILEWYRAKPHKLKAIIGGWLALANACAEMTRRGICHRDLKPGNILMTPNGLPKIVDFDSGRNLGAKTLTTVGRGAWPGTKRYYSPEVCRALLSGSGPSSRTPFQTLVTGDLHALGVILYEVLTGKYPFDEGESDEELFEQIAHHVPESPSALNPEVPLGLEMVTMKLLQKDPGLRYQFGDEVVKDLKALLKTSEDWERLFQTPAMLAARSRPKAVHPQPAPRSPLSRRALMNVVALTLALMVPCLLLVQHGALGPLLERGKMAFAKAELAVVAVVSMAFTACVGPSRNLREGDLDFVAKCPPESRKVVNELGLDPDLGLAEILDGPSVIVPEGGGVELRDGPVEVSAAIPSNNGLVVARLFGVIRTGSEGASLRFTKFKRFQKGDRKGDPPSGPLVDICAYASERGFPAPPGIRKVPEALDTRPPSERHPGFVFLTTGALGVHFAQ